MGYFRELSNFEYISPLSDRNKDNEYILAKNLFRRIKLVDDFQNSTTNFQKYYIKNGMRPDQVALELYGLSTHDWVVLISAGITNVRNQWPLSDRDIYDYAQAKYGVDVNMTRFYETKEVKDSKGRLIMPKGKVVDAYFKSPKPKVDTAPTSSYVQFWDSGLDTMITKTDITSPVTNFEYETRLNDEKRGIFVLRPSYLQQFLANNRTLMLYGSSTQTISRKIKRGENIRL